MQRLPVLFAALVVLCGSALAQKPANTGTVTGRVTCADTSAPARLARVVLRPVPSAKSAHSSTSIKPVEARSVQTLLDGSFTVSSLAPGTYMVLASMPGYITPLSVLGISNNDLLEPSDELRKRILEVVPVVSIESAAALASVNISLERGAAVSGTILYDDGSPAAGVAVRLRQRENGKWVLVQNVAGDGMWSGNSTTDDRGNYRIIGLLPMKEAIVQADLSVQSSVLQFGRNMFSTQGSPNTQLSFYSGSALRTADAKPFQLNAGEDRTGEDITLPLSKLHRVEGVLQARKDGHVLNSGSVSLLSSDDRSELSSAMLSKEDDEFRFPFVPEGDYILKVDYAADVRFDEVANSPGMMPATRTETKTLQEYGPAEIRLHVDSDRSNVVIDVPDKAPVAKTLAQQ